MSERTGGEKIKQTVVVKGEGGKENCILNIFHIFCFHQKK